MFEPWLSWCLFVAIAFIVSGREMWLRSPSVAIGVGMATGIAAATWFSVPIFGLGIECRTVIAAVLLVVFCVHSKGKFSFSWHWLDSIIVGLWVVAVVSDWRFSGATIEAPVRSYGEWLLPYFAGRFVTMRRNSASLVAPWFVGVGLLISFCAVFESVSGVNVWEYLFTPVDDLVWRGRAARYGLLYRASGPTRHPIFLAVVLMLLIPWAVLLAGRFQSSWEVKLGWIGIIGLCIGVVTTVSRGPLLGLLIAVVVGVAIGYPKARIWIVGLGICLLACVFLFWNNAVDAFELTDPSSVRSQAVELGKDDPTVFSGTRNRILVWEVYAPLVGRGGPLGFGTEAVSTFPPNIPGLPVAARSREILGIVDNSYLLVGLRFGWIGLTLLLLLLCGSIVTAIQLRRSSGIIFYPDGPAFLTAMASVLCGVCFEMLTVFFSYDFAFWVLFHCGVVAGLASLKTDMVRGIDR